MNLLGMVAWWARWIGRLPPSHRQLLEAANKADCVFLPRVEAGWVGNAMALIGLTLGVLWTKSHRAGDDGVLGWVALALIGVGMMIQMIWRHIDYGWHIDFARRRIAPEGAVGEPLDLMDDKQAGDNYCVVCTPGEKWRSLVIDIRHIERGRVARLFQIAGPARRADRRWLSTLADVLARRLQIGRAGMTF